MRAIFTDLLLSIRNAISFKTEINTITPENVGEDGFAALISVLDGIIKNQKLTGGDPEPDPGLGVDGDIYLQSGNPVLIWQKTGSIWANTGVVNFGLTFPDGNFTVKVGLDEDVITAFPGFWFIGGNMYNTVVQTQFDAAVANLTLETRSLIYGGIDGDVHYLLGTAGAGQPTLPADSVLINVLVTPPGNTGQPPYYIYSNTQTSYGGSGTVSKTIFTITSDVSGQIDLSADTIPANPMFYATQNGVTVAARFDEINKIVDGLNPSTLTKLIFI